MSFLERFARNRKPGCVTFRRGTEGRATLFNFTELRKHYPTEVVEMVSRAIKRGVERQAEREEIGARKPAKTRLPRMRIARRRAPSAPASRPVRRTRRPSCHGRGPPSADSDSSSGD